MKLPNQYETAVASLRILPQADLEVSQACETFPSSIWSFRKRAKPSPGQFGAFASLRNVPQLVLELSQACDAITQDNTAVLQRWEQSRRTNQNLRR